MSHLGLWRCRRGHVHVILLGFKRDECGARFGRGICHESGQTMDGWQVIAPDEGEK